VISLRIEKLERSHAVDAFDCGRKALNRFLVRSALQNQRAEASQTYVALEEHHVVGYYTLVVGEIDWEGAPQLRTKDPAQQPVSAMLLARLAVAEAWHGNGLGAGLLKDAMLRTLHAARIAGIRVFAVHAKDIHAKAFFEHFDFVPSPTDPYHLFRPLKELRGLLEPKKIA
jgi:predicted N-acetyltransferase YhbS